MSSLAGAAFLLHLASTLMMTGLIWFVQVVHYPLMDAIPGNTFPEYEARHVRLTTRVVAPLMLVELGTGLAITWNALSGGGPAVAVAITNLALLAVIWLSTAMVMVPYHRRLEECFDPETHRRLVSRNWVRTAAWSTRVLLLLALAPASLR